ncbi:MAG: DegT/DnrJ/EryC1/StrS aminotransferase family protein [Kofleriaceae bacterium]|nr:DegT/DnrJ/EryC1/StrS aminotransferase family protein [Kofleriaceae bacterium]
MDSEASAIPLARPSIGDAERSAAQRVLSGTQLTGGPELLRFEGLLAEISARSHAVALSSGTSALELALWALDIGTGDKVMITAFGFPAAANIVAARGAIPIAVDVEEARWCVDFDKARSLAESENTGGGIKALVTIDQLGAVTSAGDIEAFERETGISVLSDAACGLGGTDKDGRPAGSAGTMATFSFHPRKVVTTGEGGAVVCSDLEIVERLRQIRNHGQAGGGRFARIGTNARIAEVPCAIGCAQIARLEAMQAERRMLVEGYKERLSELRASGAISWQQSCGVEVHANQSFAILLTDSSKREPLLSGLRDMNIGCGVATYSFTEIGIHNANADCPVASRLHRAAVSLPLYLGMRSSELSRVCEAVRELL